MNIVPMSEYVIIRQKPTNRQEGIYLPGVGVYDSNLGRVSDIGEKVPTAVRQGLLTRFSKGGKVKDRDEIVWVVHWKDIEYQILEDE